MKFKILSNLRFVSTLAIHLLITFDVYFFCKKFNFHCVHYPYGHKCCYCDESMPVMENKLGADIGTPDPINYAIPTKFIPKNRVN